MRQPVPGGQLCLQQLTPGGPSGAGVSLRKRMTASGAVQRLLRVALFTLGTASLLFSSACTVPSLTKVSVSFISHYCYFSLTEQ